MKRIFFVSIALLIFLTCRLSALTYELLKVELYHPDLRPEELSIREIASSGDTIYLFCKQDHNFIMRTSSSGKILGIHSTDYIKNIQIVAGFSRIPDGYQIIAGEIQNNKLVYKYVELDNSLNWKSEKQISDKDEILTFRQSIHNPNHSYYMATVTHPDTICAKIFAMREDKEGIIYKKCYGTPPSSDRGAKCYFDVCQSYLALAYNESYEIDIFNLQNRSIRVFKHPTFRNEAYTEKETALLSPFMLMSAQSYPYPPAIRAIHFVNDSLFAVIRNLRPADSELLIDFISINNHLIKTISIPFQDKTICSTINSWNLLRIFSYQNKKFFMHVIEIF